MNNLLITLGGILTGGGVLGLLFGFESTTGAGVSTTFSQAGYTALDQWTITGTGQMGVGMVVLGVVMMIAGNSNIWKETGGY